MLSEFPIEDDKINAAFGFMFLYCAGIQIDSKIQENYLDYTHRRRKTFYGLILQYLDL